MPKRIASPKAQGCDPLIHWGKPRHEMAELGGNKQTHTSPPPLPVGHSRVEESPAPLKEMGSRAHAVRGGPSRFPLQVVGPLGDGLASLVRAFSSFKRFGAIQKTSAPEAKF
ncbi:hypothetical protein CRENBAI_003691 [Crenichthys baileyi]|uniref:Uncharacterized protein n=1 Tax=Crenichthys baileyi TaxID=28760 RepID=A0AAV9QNJ0_9TELE